MAKKTSKELILTLAKAMISAAWSDGEITHDERNCLKELLFNLRDISANDWASLEIYLAAPVSEQERSRILEALRRSIRTPADKRLANDAMKQMIEASCHSDHDKGLEILQAIEDINVDPLSQLGKYLRAPLRQRNQAMNQITQRESEVEEFMRNRIAFHLRRTLQEMPIAEPTEAEIQIWASAGGLLARVAHADKQVTKEERDEITQAISQHWALPDHVIASLLDIALNEIANGLDFYRLTRQFYLNSDREQRKQFVTSLFKIALADGELSHDETEEIRHIARGLKLTHRQMIAAKLKALDGA